MPRFFFIILLILIPTLGIENPLFPITPNELACLFAFAGWAFLAACLLEPKQEKGGLARFTPVSLSLFLFFAWGVAGYNTSVNLDLSQRMIVKYLGGLFLVGGLLFHLRSREQVEEILKWFLGIALGHGFVSFILQVSRPFENMNWNSFFLNPNFYSNYLLFPLAISCYFVISGKTRAELWLGRIGFVVLLVNLGYSASRGANLVAALMLGSVALYLAWQKQWKPLGILTLGGGLAILLFFSIQFSLGWYRQSLGMEWNPESINLIRKGFGTSGLFKRVFFWEGAWEIFKEFWFAGSGLWTFPMLYPFFGQAYQKFAPPCP